MKNHTNVGGNVTIQHSKVGHGMVGSVEVINTVRILCFFVLIFYFFCFSINFTVVKWNQSLCYLMIIDGDSKKIQQLCRHNSNLDE